MFVLLVSCISACDADVKPKEKRMTKAEWEAESKPKSAALKKAKEERGKFDSTNRMDTVYYLNYISTNTLSGTDSNLLEKAQAHIGLLIEDLEEARSAENSLTKVRFGYVSFAPYTISKTPASPADNPAYTMDEADSAGSAFIEVTFADRLAWRTDTGREQGRDLRYGFSHMKDKTLKNEDGTDKMKDGKPEMEKNAILVERRPWDWEAKLGFILTDNLENGQTSGSAIAAGGDIYAELAAGYPLFYFEQNNGLQISMNIPEVVGTWVTDKSSFDIHDSYKVCVAFVARGNVGTKGRAWKMLARVGPGWVETPGLTGDLDNITGNPLVNVENGKPKFNTEFGLATQVLFDVPIFEHSTVSLSGEFWNVDDINPWSTYISYSKTFTELREFLKF